MVKYPYLTALLDYSCSVEVEWAVDELQADPVQHTWSWKKAKKELQKLLQLQDSAGPEIVGYCCGRCFKVYELWEDSAKCCEGC